MTNPETIAAQRLAKLREAVNGLEQEYDATAQIRRENRVLVTARDYIAALDQPAPESPERNTALREAVSGFLARWGSAMDRQKPRLFADVVDAMRIAFDAPESNKCAECERKDVAIRELLHVFEKEAGNTVFISNADEMRVMEAVASAQHSKLR